MRIRAVPQGSVAIHRYSGLWSTDIYAQHERMLLNALAADGISTLGVPVSARYNPPFTPWLMRRNEIMNQIERGERPTVAD